MRRAGDLDALKHGALAVLVTCLSLASPDQAGQPPIYRGRTDLLTINVTAVDGDGHSVRGLVAEDFNVEVNGTRCPVRVVDLLEQRVATKSAPTSTADLQHNQSSAESPPHPRGRVFMVLFDDLSFSPGDGKGFLVAVDRTIARLDPQDLVGLATTSGLGPTLAPTADRSRMRAILRDRRLVGRDLSRQGYLSYFVSTKEALEIANSTRDVLRFVAQRECEAGSRGAQCGDQIASVAKAVAVEAIRRAPMQLEAYSHIVEALREAPAPRILLWLTAGIALGAERDWQQQLEPLVRAAASAGVQLYALVDSDDGLNMSDVGRPSPLIPTEYSRNGARRANSRFMTSGMQTLAEAVGGTAFSVVGQPDRFLSRALEETASVYRLGIELPTESDGAKPFNVRVMTKKPRVVLRTAQYAWR